MAIRVPSTDFRVCRQWVDGADVARRSDAVRLIVDAGANIGASSLMLARRFPKAVVVAIELEPDNFAMLERNVEGHDRIDARHAGLWDVPGQLSAQADRLQEAWGFRAKAIEHPAATGIAAVTVDLLLEEFARSRGCDRIDVLKMDIEGGELNVLRTCESWIDRVDAIMIELHESIAPGSEAAFESAFRDFPVRWQEGELVCRARDGAAILDCPQGRTGRMRTPTDGPA